MEDYDYTEPDDELYIDLEPDVDDLTELEDFEQADEYFNHYDYSNEDIPW